MRITLIAIACGVSLAACGSDVDMVGDTGAAATASSAAAVPAAQPMTANATIRNAAGRELGTLILRDSVGGIQISGRLRGLPPGSRAMHVHETGLCDPPFESAGGHWNPTGRQHGSDNPMGAHFGDVPNITVSTDSAVSVQTATLGGTLSGPNALLDGDGAAVVIHAQPDDDRSDPAGNAGPRIACGAVSSS